MPAMGAEAVGSETAGAEAARPRPAATAISLHSGRLSLFIPHHLSLPGPPRRVIWTWARNAVPSQALHGSGTAPPTCKHAPSTDHTPIWAESNSASAEDSMHRRRLRSKLSCVLAAESHTSQDEASSSKMLCSTKLLKPSATKIGWPNSSSLARMYATLGPPCAQLPMRMARASCLLGARSLTHSRPGRPRAADERGARAGGRGAGCSRGRASRSVSSNSGSASHAHSTA